MKNINHQGVLSLVALSILAAAPAACISLSPASTPPTAASGLAQTCTVPCLNTSNTLEDLVDCIEGYMPHRYSVDGRDGFEVPTPAEIAQWREVVGQMMAGECDAVDLSGYAWGDDFVVTTFTDTQNAHAYCVLMETTCATYTVNTDTITRVTHGWGTFVHDPGAQRELNISAPHAKYETNTGPEAAGIFKDTQSRTLLMTGAHRNASDVDSTCQGDRKRSDAAHNTAHMFYATVAELKEYYDTRGTPFYHLQFHGMSTCCADCDVCPSHGSDQPPQPGNKILDLRDNLLVYHLGWRICLPGDGTCTLNGTTNVPGRLLNRVPDDQVCDTAAAGYSGYFIHIEQCLDYRDPDDWAPAIRDTWPICYLPLVLKGFATGLAH